MNGIDLFGRMMTIEENVITEACYSKGDCGAIRVYGRTSLAATPARDVVIRADVIRDTIGNTDGCHPDFEPLFGFGIYIDNNARDVEVTGNTVIGSTASGLLYQLSTGQITGHVLFSLAPTRRAGAVLVAGPGPRRRRPVRRRLRKRRHPPTAGAARRVFSPSDFSRCRAGRGDRSRG